MRSTKFALVTAGLGLSCIGPPPSPPGVSETAWVGTSDNPGVVPSSTTAEFGSSSGAISSTTSTSDAATTDSSATTTADGSRSGGQSDTGAPPSPIGCADGTRDALIDQAVYPNIAACAGGFGIPGVHVDAPQCNRQGGNHGPLPDGMSCSIDDLCAAGWHLCISMEEVFAAGLVDCGGISWNTQFFVTRQSGEGSSTCGATGTNDLYGCGDIGYPKIVACNPLNRSTGNLCSDLMGPWACRANAFDEANNVVKTGSDYGGALCCVDGA